MLHNFLYTLEGKTPVHINDMREWSKWRAHADRTVDFTRLPDGVTVSTVFTGINSIVFSNEPPLLFETMIFGGEHDQYKERYCTWEEAEAGHQLAIEMIFEVH